MPPPNTMRGICGGEALGQGPSESTFSRAFDPFSSDNRPQAIHEALIKTHDGEKIAGHISRDATAIHAREKAVAKARPEEKTQSKPGAESNGGKRGRRRKDDPPAPPPEPKRLQQQLERDLEANLADLPTLCDWGCKKNSNLYDLADAAYDAKQIREMSARLGHVPIIDDNPG